MPAIRNAFLLHQRERAVPVSPEGMEFWGRTDFSVLYAFVAPVFVWLFTSVEPSAELHS